MQVLEDQLANVYKSAPKLSDRSKESLVKAWPWIALIFGILQVLAAWSLWNLTRVVTTISNYADQVSYYYTGNTTGISSADKTAIYIGLIVLLVDGVLLLMAYPKLKVRAKRGWDLLYLGALLNVGYGVIEIFISGRGIGSFVFSLIGSAIGFYLLFQVRDKYKS